MQLFTRPDFDGVVSTAMITTVEMIQEVNYSTPQDVQERMIEIDFGDAIAHLPFHPDARLWFQNHDASSVNPAMLKGVRGSFKAASSTSRLIYEFYKSDKLTKYAHLVDEVDRIATANLTVDDIKSPKGWVLVSNTLDARFIQEHEYTAFLIEAIKEGLSADQVIAKPPVDKRIKRYYHDEDIYQENLSKYTHMVGNVIVTDFRALESEPHGNRFSVFPAYPDGNVHIRLQASGTLRVKVSVSKSITNKTCNINIGKMLEEFGGGGPAGAGTCMLSRNSAEQRIEEIIGKLKE